MKLDLPLKRLRASFYTVVGMLLIAPGLGAEQAELVDLAKEVGLGDVLGYSKAISMVDVNGDDGQRTGRNRSALALRRGFPTRNPSGSESDFSRARSSALNRLCLSTSLRLVDRGVSIVFESRPNRSAAGTRGVCTRRSEILS